MSEDDPISGFSAPISGALTCQEDQAAVQMSRRDYSRLTIEDLALILRLNAEGRTQRQIAEVIGCSHQSVSYALQRVKASQSDITAVMKMDSLTQITNWQKAAAKAVERGDHRPAREYLEAAYPELRPAAAQSAGGGGVVINIGTLEPPAIQVVSPQSGEP